MTSPQLPEPLATIVRAQIDKVMASFVPTDAIQSEIDRLDRAAADVVEQLTAVGLQISEAAQKAKKEVSETIAASIADIGTVKDGFATKLASEFSGVAQFADYWQKARSRHKRMSIAFGVAVALCFLSVFILATSHITGTDSDSAQAAGTDWRSVRFLIALAASGALATWFIGILTNLFRSSIHLYNDADHRIASMTAFVEMRTRDQLSNEAAETLFAYLITPPKAGILKDAETPPALRPLRSAADKVKGSSDE